MVWILMHKAHLKLPQKYEKNIFRIFNELWKYSKKNGIRKHFNEGERIVQRLGVIGTFWREIKWKEIYGKNSKTI